MTVIAIRGGIMAVDSLISCAGNICGEIKKWSAVPDIRGGGFIASTGDASLCARSVQAFINSGAEPSDGVVLVHMKSDGVISICESGAWFEYAAPFYAEGSGASLAMAAMHAGASAEEAVRIAIKMRPSECGGEVHVLSVAT